MANLFDLFSVQGHFMDHSVHLFIPLEKIFFLIIKTESGLD